MLNLVFFASESVVPEKKSFPLFVRDAGLPNSELVLFVQVRHTNSQIFIIMPTDKRGVYYRAVSKKTLKLTKRVLVSSPVPLLELLLI